MSRLIIDIKYGLKEIFRDKMNLFWIFYFSNGLPASFWKFTWRTVPNFNTLLPG